MNKFMGFRLILVMKIMLKNKFIQRIVLVVVSFASLASSVGATTITVSSFSLPNYQYGGTTATLRLYASESFFTSDGTLIVGAAAGSSGFFKSITCTVASNMLTCPAFTLFSTTDSIDRPNVQYTAVLYDYKGQKRDVVFSNTSVPVNLGTTVSMAQLRLYNATRTPVRDLQNTYTKDQVNAQIAQAISSVAATASPQNYVLAFSGGQQSVEFSDFYAPPPTTLGNFFWEVWAKPGPSASGTYLLSDGYGGAHAILFGLVADPATSGRYVITGNVWNGTTYTSFGSDDGPAVSEWANLAVGWDGATIVTYYDGVAVGRTPFAGPRLSQGLGGNGFGKLYVGGSDHQNFQGNISQVRGYENSNPLNYAPGNQSVMAGFAPQTVHSVAQFSGAIYGSLRPTLMVNFFVPTPIVPNLWGTAFPGWLRGSANSSLTPQQAYPAPQYVIDPTAPTATTTSLPSVPVATQSPLPAPPGALIFDSFNRTDSLYVFDRQPNLGATEGGSRGPQVWDSEPYPGAGQSSYGILRGRVVALANQTSQARVEAQTTDVDVRVDRSPGGWGSGISTGIVFRYVNPTNHCFAFTGGASASTQGLVYGCTVSGATTYYSLGAPLPTTWTTLRVVSKASGQISVYVTGNTAVVYNTTSSANASGTKVGLYSDTFGRGLSNRWDNFTVYAAP